MDGLLITSHFIFMRHKLKDAKLLLTNIDSGPFEVLPTVACWLQKFSFKPHYVRLLLFNYFFPLSLESFFDQAEEKKHGVHISGPLFPMFLI